MVFCGQQQRQFMTCKSILSQVPLLSGLRHDNNQDSCIYLAMEPEVFSLLLEFLVTGHLDWRTKPILSSAGIFLPTVLYCEANNIKHYNLSRLALNTQKRLDVEAESGFVLKSARYAYESTSENTSGAMSLLDAELRQYYLQLMLRHRSFFKNSPEMAIEMMRGGQHFFALFGALVGMVEGHDRTLQDPSQEQQQSLTPTVMVSLDELFEEPQLESETIAGLSARP